MRMLQKKYKKILIIGLRHGAQDKCHFKKRLKFLQSHSFSQNFIKIEKKILLAMRKEMLKLIKKFKPDVIFEECSPWLKKPGDTWKKYSGSKKTILEKLYNKKHFFVDAKLLKSDKKPTTEKREKAIAEQVAEILNKNKFNKGVLIVGIIHLKNITQLLKKSRIKTTPKNLKNTKEIKILIKKWHALKRAAT